MNESEKNYKLTLLMRIKYLGHSSFQIKNKTVTVVTDPFDPTTVGLKYPKVEADIITVSHDHKDHNQSQLVGKPTNSAGRPLVFDFPGDYEAHGVRVYGYQTFHDSVQGAERGENIMFKVIINNVVLLHCGDLGQIPSRELLDEVADANIILVPVGGHYTLNPQEAKQMVEIIKPEVVIPMHYNLADSAGKPRLNQANFSQLAPVAEFLKLMGKESLEPVAKLEINEGELPEGEVILLNISN